MNDLNEKIKRLKETIPMHMPGHKRNISLSGQGGYLESLSAFADITEIEGFDNLNDPRELFVDSMRKAARLWRSDETFFSVNGGTGGILASITGSLPYGSKVILSRNCHSSVYNALDLRGADAVYTVPSQNAETGMFYSISPLEIEQLLNRHPDTRLVIVTSPTYEGVVSDIKSICDICHSRNVPVLVDEAHGCHFGFGYGFPESAVSYGADIVVQSIHKTLAGLTQTALIHLNGKLIDRVKIKNALSIFQSSSPSYLLSASIDGCIGLLESYGKNLFESWQRNLDFFYTLTSNLKHLKTLHKEIGMFDFDRSKIVIVTANAGITGVKLAEILRNNYKIEVEMAAPAYLIAMTGIGDTYDNIHAFAQALTEIDHTCITANNNYTIPIFTLPEKFFKAFEIDTHVKTEISLESAAGQISGEYVTAYPPGIPLVIPGERITEYIIKIVRKYMKCGIKIKSTFSALPEKIFVITD